MVQLGNAWPAGYLGGTQGACPSGLSRVANGGGCGPSNLPSSVYVGPFATVLSGVNVSGTVRVEDHATLVSGNITGGTIGALSLVGSTTAPYNNYAFNVGPTAKIQTTFMPLGYFESGQSASGSAWLFGDVEFRGVGFSVSSGSYYGYVDNTIASETINDITTPPPYAWR
jgi:hypothetical protein